MSSFLRWGVILSFFISLVSLSTLILKTFSFGKKPLYARPTRNTKEGILYASTLGMLPWEKESSAKHLPTYLAGILYHLSVFTALFYLLSFLIPFRINLPFIGIFRFLFTLGFVSGLGLLLKRVFLPRLRDISCPDDFASNLMVDLFLILALANTLSLKFMPIFYLASIILFLYLPLGKIRHCFFFFYARILFGLFYGKRGTLPPKLLRLKG